jgi:hypothetical protein
VVLANWKLKCGACEFGGSTELVHLVGVSISLKKNFYRLPFTPPLSGRLIGLQRTGLGGKGLRSGCNGPSVELGSEVEGVVAVGRKR